MKLTLTHQTLSLTCIGTRRPAELVAHLNSQCCSGDTYQLSALLNVTVQHATTLSCGGVLALTRSSGACAVQGCRMQGVALEPKRSADTGLHYIHSDASGRRALLDLQRASDSLEVA